MSLIIDKVSYGLQGVAAVIDVVNSGFTMEQAMEAWHIVGDDTNLMIEYIFNNIL